MPRVARLLFLLAAGCRGGEESTQQTNDEADVANAEGSEPPAEIQIGGDAPSQAGLPADPPCVPSLRNPPRPDALAGMRISELGLYRDLPRGQPACDLVPYEPRFALWSDGADKRRWIVLPPGTHIDNREPSTWHVPVGTWLVKEFSRDGKRLETRVIARLANDEVSYSTFVWLDDDSDALLVSEGAADVRGTAHDVPTRTQCDTCHRGEVDRLLGISDVQRPNLPRELFLVDLTRYEPPGDDTTRAALGYLHANCGHCHNPRGAAYNMTSLHLQLRSDQHEPLRTSIALDTVDIPLERAAFSPGLRLRVAPGDPASSALLSRMRERGTDRAMPPIASEQTDALGIATVSAWITSLGVRPTP